MAVDVKLGSHTFVLTRIILAISFFFIQSLSIEASSYSMCNQTYNCGNISKISYPFWGQDRPRYCGSSDQFELTCDNETTFIKGGQQKFRVVSINPAFYSMKLVQTDLSAGCPWHFTNISLDPTLFRFDKLSFQNLTIFYDCPSLVSSPYNITCKSGKKVAFFAKQDEQQKWSELLKCRVHVQIPIQGAVPENAEMDELNKTLSNGFVVQYKVDWILCLACNYSGGMCGTGIDDASQFSCHCRNGIHPYSCAKIFHKEALQLENYFSECQFMVEVPVKINASVNFTTLLKMNYTEILKTGFLVNWSAPDCQHCEKSGGRCGFDDYKFLCFCKDKPHLITCDDERPWNWRRKLIVGAASSSFSVIVMSIAFYFYLRRKKNRSAKSYVQSQRRTISWDSSIKNVEKGSKYFGVHLFTYIELEEATNYFDSARELGDGGFGTVYYGKLGDGRTVAVKRLYENNRRIVEQFMNEVEILTRLHHHNLVQLYGCTSRHSRELLLVYEYIPNGTLADHLHGKRAKPDILQWHTRMNIAIETASALAYLHASDVIHRDVKTTNILLDNHFVVKVADFGLSRLFPNDVTHISTAPQGTPGYVDPEYHRCYQLTGKSDVYSFGVVLIELISSMPAVDITRHRDEINLSNMAINKIQKGQLHELVDPTLGFEADYKVRKMITGVAELAFQCLQSVKDARPSMEEVAERLREIQNDEKDRRKAEEMDISEDHVVLLKNEQPPASPDSNMRSTSTTPNTSK